QKTKEHDVVQRQRVVDLWKDGKSEGAIGQELRMPKSTVHSIIKWQHFDPKKKTSNQPQRQRGREVQNTQGEVKSWP
uniref:Transposase IS30-like HTH domain-containing protein n=1 Tax=Mastacembelus armatus TaxID=205130 RepID=A0A3Q3KV43_9TELE